MKEMTAKNKPTTRCHRNGSPACSMSSPCVALLPIVMRRHLSSAVRLYIFSIV